MLFSGDALAPNDHANPCFGTDLGIPAAVFDGVRCAIQNTRRHGGRPSDTNGDVGATTNGRGGADPPVGGVVAQGGYGAGQTRHFQLVYRENIALQCMTGLNTSNAVSVAVLP